VKHRTRPEHHRAHPVHVTLRATRGLPSFRAEHIRNLLERILDGTRDATGQVVHFSIQRDHLHVVLEAHDKRLLSSLVRRVVIRFALRLNKVLGRTKGKVWGDRYHRRDLQSPREVKNALRYLFTNAVKHGEPGASPSAPDPFTCTPRLPGFLTARDAPAHWRPPRPRTWLLSTGWWKIHGPLAVGVVATGAT
jgi:REP element-mobilizing transposase RayT